MTVLHEMEQLITECRNERSLCLDSMTTMEILTCMNEEDRSVSEAVARCLDNIAMAVDCTVKCLQNGGRLFYVGAGTSGRIGALDAYECPPTFGVDQSLVRALVAGGSDAPGGASEEAEDDMEQGEEDMNRRSPLPDDVVVGIAASGRTPYVIGAMKAARAAGAATVALSCNSGSAVGELADIKIEVLTGPEVLTGSTRLKAGTAQKMVLNMISTASMVKMGKVYKNLMVDMRPENRKLKLRAARIIQQAANVPEERAVWAYEKSGGDVKAGIVMLLANCGVSAAKKALELADGHVRKSIMLIGKCVP